jgi:hypothetical protein
LNISFLPFCFVPIFFFQCWKNSHLCVQFLWWWICFMLVIWCNKSKKAGRKCSSICLSRHDFFLWL